MCYFAGVVAGTVGAGAPEAGAGTAGAGAAGVAAGALDLDVFENCCRTELPVDPVMLF